MTRLASDGGSMIGYSGAYTGSGAGGGMFPGNTSSGGGTIFTGDCGGMMT